VKKIPLSQGKFAIVDDADFEWLNQWKWSASRVGKLRDHFIAVRAEASKTILMSREIVRAQAGSVVDHIDGNPLNNQRGNLRICTQAENSLNNRGALRRRNGTKPGYKGVYWHAGAGRWMASFRNKYLGLFADPSDAARAYDAAARAYSPEFARTNFSDGGEECRG